MNKWGLFCEEKRGVEDRCRDAGELRLTGAVQEMDEGVGGVGVGG